MAVSVMASTGRAERDYTYVLTVGMNPNDPNYDPLINYDTINAAISAMNEKDPPLAPDRLGVICIYDGVYEEHLNDCYRDRHNLPAHCDLIGMGTEIDDVVIWHKILKDPNLIDCNTCDQSHCPPGGYETLWFGVVCNGDNLIYNLKVENKQGAQFSVRFDGDGELANCIIVTAHAPAVECAGHLVMSGCVVSGYYYECVRAKSTFEISDCSIYPKVYSAHGMGEFPVGIRAFGSGTIDNVYIYGDDEINNLEGMRYDPGGLYGIELLISGNEMVKISNTTIDLKLKFDYLDPNHLAPNRVCGILSGWKELTPSSKYDGYTVVVDCNISVAADEYDKDPNNPSGPMMVSGVYVRGGGSMELWGDTSIATDRIGDSNEGYQYLLYNENGTLAVDFNTVVFDPNGDGDPCSYDANYTSGDIDQLYKARNITQEVNYVFIDDATEDANSGDVIQAFQGYHPGPINFDGKALTLTGGDVNDWDVVGSTVIDGEGASAAVTFDSNEDANTVLTGLTIRNADYGIYCYAAGPTINRCIVEDNTTIGLLCYVDSNAVICNNKVKGTEWGHGIAAVDSVPSIKNNWIHGNAYGIGLQATDAAVTIRNNTIADNSSGGVVVYNPESCAAPAISNCILWNNADDLNACAATYSCVSDANDLGDVNTTHNICDDPLFVDRENDDFHLDPNSPCINAGDPNGNYDNETDIDNELREQPRTVGGSPAIVDIGVDECLSRVHNISQDKWYLCIGDAIDDANDGEEVIALADTYYEQINFQGKSITLRSANPENWSVVESTVIDAGGSGPPVTFNSGEDSNSVLRGFLLRNGTNGIDCTSGPTISRCVIEGNSNGVYLSSNCSPSIMNNRIHQNGCGICSWWTGTPHISNNWIHNNGWGMQFYVTSSPALVYNNTILDNNVAGVCRLSGEAPTIFNCIIWGNTDDLVNCSATYSCIKDGDAGTGNIDTDPCFADADANDFHLDVRSPCVNGGDPNGSHSGETDIDGQARVNLGQVDMGADEVYSSLLKVHNVTTNKWYVTISDAIDDATSGNEIAAGQSTYRENIDFDGKAISVRSTDPNDPNVVATTIIDGNESGNVVTFDSSETSSSVLEGLTITNGNTGIYCYYASPTISKCVITGNTTTGYNDGAGMYNDNSDPNVLNCTFSNNQADDGGGMYNYYSDPAVNNCTFSYNNSADDGGGMYNYYSDPLVVNCTFTDNNSTDNGAGMYNRDSDASVLNCTFSSNEGDDGGGMYNDYGQPIVCNCTFSGNSADDEGGGMYNEDCEVIVDDCVFAENTASYDGGGIHNVDIDSTSKITSSVFWANSAEDGGGIANSSSDHDILNCTFFDNDADDDGGAIYNSGGSDGDIANCIFWQNSAGGSGDDIYNSGTSNPYMHSNFYDDPDFLDENDQDGTDNVWGTCDDGLNLDSSSDCIDEGDDDDSEEDYDDLDIKDSDREIDGDPDIGAYEYDPGS
jgi:parallel beta-helix repeat protein